MKLGKEKCAFCPPLRQNCYTRTMIKLLLSISILIFTAHSSLAAERSYAFIVTMHGEYVKVVSPKEYTSDTTVIIENKTLSRVYGKVTTQTGRLISMFSVPSLKVRTVPLKLKAGEEAFVVPLAPAFQSFKLKFGNLSYEIPPKK